ncbi:MAG TPA: ATPase [Candidatus Angelobacter sp.]|nr:ATPase [Candidatus Angelobacter sp.]
MSRKIVFIALVCALASTINRAEVADSGATGFTIKITTSIHAAPAEVYKKLVHNIGDWWSSQHTFSGDAHNLSIEERPMGCFCEKLVNGGGVRHMEVVFFSPGKRLVLSGGLGPLQGIGAAGAMTFNLTADKDGTKLEVTYAVTGYLSQGMNSWAAPVDGVLTEQITRFKNYVESGNPAGAGTPDKKPPA